MPLLAQEFRVAAREFPILFAGNSDQVTPAVLLGLGPNENLFVDAEGHWLANYIPAFARRYPFIFSSVDQGKTLTLCIDEEFPGLNTEGEGQRLFTDDGEQTEYLNSVLEFHKDFQIAQQRTQAFCKRLVELDLLESMQMQLRFGSGEKIAISGFMAVDRGKLKALKGDRLVKLNRIDELELIFLHLQSLQNIDEVAKQVRAGDDAAPKPTKSGTRAPAAKTAASPNAKTGTASKTAAKSTAKKTTAKSPAKKTAAKSPAKKTAAKSTAKKTKGKKGNGS